MSSSPARSSPDDMPTDATPTGDAPPDAASPDAAPTPHSAPPPDAGADPAAPAERRAPGNGLSGPPEGDAEGCSNCGATLNGPYCAVCGQRAASRVVPLWHLTNEFFEDLFELDLRIFRTLPRFLFLPGRLTKEYVAGRRRRYVRPLRMYLFSSFLLFTLLAFTNIEGLQDFLSLEQDVEAAQEAAAEAQATADSLRGAAAFDASEMQALRERMLQEGVDPAQIPTVEEAVRKALSAGGAEMRAGLESGRASLGALRSPAASDAVERPSLAQVLVDSLEFNVTAGDSTTGAQVEKLLEAKFIQATQNPGEYLRSMLDKAPYLMFALLPAFALLLKLLYLRRGRLYVEHLVFALHVHALAFIAFSVTTVLHEFASGWLVTAGNWIAATPLLYLILAMRTVYDQSVGKSSVKALLLLFGYSLLLITALIILAVVTFVLL